jgi:predicted nucleic acid-binding protein
MWVKALQVQGLNIIVPEIVDYELRRELLRSDKLRGIGLLEQFIASHSYVPLTTEAMRKAAEFWAQARKDGKQTADDKALDGDVILAAQVACLGLPLDSIIVATTNPGHISRFVPARRWQEITIGEE